MTIVANQPLLATFTMWDVMKLFDERAVIDLLSMADEDMCRALMLVCAAICCADFDVPADTPRLALQRILTSISLHLAEEGRWPAAAEAMLASPLTGPHKATLDHHGFQIVMGEDWVVKVKQRFVSAPGPRVPSVRLPFPTCVYEPPLGDLVRELSLNPQPRWILLRRW